MRTKYETPELEIVRFSLKTNVLTASVPTDNPETTFTDIVIDGGEDGENPFG